MAEPGRIRPPCRQPVIQPGLATGSCARPLGHAGLHSTRLRAGEVTAWSAPADGPNAGAQEVRVGVPDPRVQDAVGTDARVKEDWRERALTAEARLDGARGEEQAKHITFMQAIALAFGYHDDGPLPDEARLVDDARIITRRALEGARLRERLRRVLTDADDADEAERPPITFGSTTASWGTITGGTWVADPPDLGTCTSASPDHVGRRLDPHAFADGCTDWIPIAVGRHAEPGPTAREYVGRPRSVSCVPGCVLTQGHWNCVTVHATPGGPAIVLPTGGAEVVTFGTGPEA